MEQAFYMPFSFSPEVLALRAAELAALPRIGTSPIDSRERLVCNLEEIAFAVGSLLEARRLAADPDWWHSQDTLGDVLDALEAVRRIPVGTVLEAVSLGEGRLALPPSRVFVPGASPSAKR